MQLSNYTSAQNPQDSIISSTNTEIIIEDVIMHKQRPNEAILLTKTTENFILQALEKWRAAFFREEN